LRRGAGKYIRIRNRGTTLLYHRHDLQLSESALFFPPADERIQLDDLLTRILASAAERTKHGPVVPDLDMNQFRSELAAFDFNAPRSIEKTLAWVVGQLEQGIVHLTHPRYFGLYNPSPSFPAICADRIAATFNPQLATWTTSPVAVEIEQHVIQAVARRVGFGSSIAGHFTSGGAEANYTALLLALTSAEPGFARRGVRAFSGAPVLYISKEAHLTWEKAAHQAGIGRDAVRPVATDGTGRMDLAALADQITRDRASDLVPVMVVATAGTTAAGMIDPLRACSEIAIRAGIWYHVDAAWGGAAIASDRLRPLLDGMERADSVTIDAHKWFATTMGCGMFITAHPGILNAAFSTSASYMPSNLVLRDPYTASVQWSRRFTGLRLFLSLAVGGWAAHAAHIERSVDLTRRLQEILQEQGWLVVNQSGLAVLCLEPPPGSASVDAIAQAIVSSGRAWVSVAETQGRRVIRACVTHGETSLRDVAILAECLKSAAQPDGRI
jgi:glutamate/tyrosine decarboxylase-like PLP-dependent enzyme